VAMKIPDPDPSVPGDTSAVHYRAVHMTWNSTTPTFESYIPGANGSGGVDGRFVGTIIGPAESGTYAAPFNKVVIVIKASDLGLKPGDVLSGFVSGVAQDEPSAASGTAVPLYDQMPDSLSFANSYVVNFNSICAATTPGVVSRKIHGPAGPFDIALPTGGSAAIEPRSGGARNAYTLVYTFGSNLGFAGAAAVTQGNANMASTVVGPNLNQVTVNPTDVVNLQHLVVTLTGAQDASHVVLAPQAAHVDVLVGDVNGSRQVDSGDVLLVQKQNGKALPPNGTADFRRDLNANGFIDSGDVSITQKHNPSLLRP
jgi:hypothetical protein